MSKRNYIAFILRWVAPVVVLASAASFVYVMGARPKPDRKKNPPRKSIPVQVVTAHRHKGTLDIEVSGVAIPYREVELSARVGGEIVFKSEALSPGNYVRQGQLLLRIDPEDFQLEVTRLEQEVEKANIQLERLALDLANSQRLLKIHGEIVALRQSTIKRNQELRLQRATSESEVEAAQLSLLTAQQQVTTQENQIRGFETEKKLLERSRDLAKLQLQRARLELKRTEIVAPFSGVVIQNHVELNSNVAAGGRVATLEDTSMIEVRCSLQSKDMPFILGTETPLQAAEPDRESVEPRQEIEITEGEDAAPAPTSKVSTSELEAVGETPRRSKPPVTTSEDGDAYRLPPVPVTVEYQRGEHTFKWSGVLSRQDGLGIDQATRTLPVRIRVPNPADSETSTKDSIALLRGMFVKVRLHCQPTTPIVTIPETVLRPGKTVWLLRDGMLHIEKINIAAINSGTVYVDVSRSPSLFSDHIISSPVPNARNGLAVTLASDSKKGNAARGAPGNSPKKRPSERDGVRSNKVAS